MSRKVNELVKELLKTTQNYKRITQKRLDEVNQLIETVEETVKGIEKTVEEIWIEIEGSKFRFKKICSKVGCWFRLQDDEYRVFPTTVEKIGGSTYLHSDLDCYIKFMDRETVLKVIRNWPKIIGQFQKELERKAKEIEEISKTF